MEYYVDFIGTLIVKAKDKEEAKEKFWAWVENHGKELRYIGIDMIEEKN